ncbi:anaphase-promoting complex subunit 10 [Fusarium phyllophilum]|uniref:Anaphase-promoting complex subunit 10 n=1 Tax=Fusarium phyllophilum TaxID=47803 RepID=A0A8H5JGQ1_9HYPO|nr:anaphase-promoting complex subunit 10 [Fusarium phyllophilum]
MDITRGSRRARHVAATHANPNTSTNARAQANRASSPRPVPSDITSSPVPQVPAATPSGPSTRLHPSQGASPLAAGSMITPDGPPIHRTPDQPPDQRRRRAPPPNPFRLYRSCCLHLSSALIPSSSSSSNLHFILLQRINISPIIPSAHSSINYLVNLLLLLSSSFLSSDIFTCCSQLDLSFITELVLPLSEQSISSLNMPSRREIYIPPPPASTHRINRDHRIKRVPLQDLAFKKSSGALLQQRKRVFRTVPSPDKENVEACYRAIDHLSVTFEEWYQERMRILRESRALRTSINNILLAAQQPTDRSRLSMPPRDSDASSSDAEPDESILFNRARPMAAPGGPSSDATMAYNDDQAAEDDADQRTLSHSPEEYEDENSIGEEEEEDDVDDDEDDEEAAEHDQAHEAATLFDPATAGLKEISNLARFTVSSHKPGNGVEELKSDDLKLFWQSDGPQPHKLTMYFTKRVGIRDIRFYVDYNEDESYTPTKVVFKAGTSENNLIEFATVTLENPSGWQQVPIAGAGGGPDGNTLVAWVVQMRILENHQNGKDTHLRGIKIYSFDNDSALGPGRDGNPVEDVLDLMDTATSHINPSSTRSRLSNFGASNFESGEGGLAIPEFMREPEIR